MTVQEKFEYLETVYRRKYPNDVTVYFGVLINMSLPNKIIFEKIANLYNVQGHSLNSNTYKTIKYSNNLILVVNLLYKIVKNNEDKSDVKQ